MTESATFIDNCVVNANRVLVEPLQVTEKTVNGLIRPTTVKETKFKQGIIRKIGDGKRDKKTKENIPLDMNIGEYVLYEQTIHTSTVTLNGKEYVILTDDDVILVSAEEFKDVK